ncbi:MAG: EF-P lysine aminoacylase GenX [Gammaproteobacteria bacterium]|nr:EF-P lysine aminoacylase GenX [Gammaproteobacteria bacterium]
MQWQPSASLDALVQRARLLGATRDFFGQRGLLEVETPALVAHAVSDPHLDNIPVQLADGRRLWLHTSPEYHMKRLLAAGAPDIWQLGKVFRDGEAGRRHEPEFTLIEWYRHDFTLRSLAAESCELIAVLASVAGRSLAVPVYLGYRELFLAALDIDPLTADAQLLRNCARRVLGSRMGPELEDGLGEDIGAWLDLLMSHAVDRHLAGTDIAVISGYPAGQAALARIDPADDRIAERFEVFCGGLEVANGYRELCAAGEQSRRFGSDRAARERLGRPDVVPDAALLAALEAGLPDCAGVALGFDRLLMFLLGLPHIRSAISFPAGS